MLGTKLLLSRISKNTPLFGKYLVTLIGKLVALTLLHYHSFILPRLEDSSIKLLFGTILTAIIYDIWKCHKTWENRFNWKNYLVSEGYYDTISQVQSVPKKILQKYSHGNLPILIKQASNVPLLLFEVMDKLFDLGCGIFAFIFIAAWGNLIGIIQLIIGLIIALNIINNKKQKCQLSESVNSIFIFKKKYNRSPITDKNDIFLEYIINDVIKNENKRININFNFWKRLMKAYIILLLSVIFTIIRTIEFDSISSIVIHAYIFSQFTSLVELWIYIEVPHQQAIQDNIILEELYNLGK
jgi:hypothetical protein